MKVSGLWFIGIALDLDEVKPTEPAIISEKQKWREIWDRQRNESMDFGFCLQA